MSIDQDTGNILRTRGDTLAESLNVTNSETGAVIDVTNYSFSMSVSQEQAPKSANILFTITASLVDASNGKISFPFTLASANDNFGSFYYQIKTTFPASAGTKVTKKGTIEFEESIDKT